MKNKKQVCKGMNHITDILIIGGGVIGTSIAYHLRKLGIDAALVEREEIGSQASSAAAGLLAPLGPLSGPGPLADLLLASFAMFPTLVPELEEASGMHLGYERLGALRTIRNPKRIAHLQKASEGVGTARSPYVLADWRGGPATRATPWARGVCSDLCPRGIANQCTPSYQGICEGCQQFGY